MADTPNQTATTTENETNPTPETPAKTAATNPAAVVDPTKITVSRAEIDDLRNRVREFDAAKAEADRVAEEAAEAKAREKGEYESLLRDRNDKITARDKTIESERQARRDLETTAGRALARAELIAALPSGVLEGKSGQLVRLLMDEVESSLVDGEFVIKAKDGRSVAEFVKDEVTKNYQHFLTASSKGGAGAGGGKPSPTEGKKEGATLGDLMVARLRQEPAKPGGVAFSQKYNNN